MNSTGNTWSKKGQQRYVLCLFERTALLQHHSFVPPCYIIFSSYNMVLLGNEDNHDYLTTGNKLDQHFDIRNCTLYSLRPKKKTNFSEKHPKLKYKIKGNFSPKKNMRERKKYQILFVLFFNWVLFQLY